jgi:hypothetical protein
MRLFQWVAVHANGIATIGPGIFATPEAAWAAVEVADLAPTTVDTYVRDTNATIFDRSRNIVQERDLRNEWLPYLSNSAVPTSTDPNFPF